MKTSRQELLTTVVGLGFRSASQAEAMTDEELIGLIERYTPSEHESNSMGQAADARKPGAKPSPEGEGGGPTVKTMTVPGVGHIIVISKDMMDENGQALESGQLLTILSMQGGTIYATDGDTTYMLDASDLGQQFDNTGITVGDVVRTNANVFGVVRGITRNKSLAVNPIEGDTSITTHNNRPALARFSHGVNAQLGAANQVELDEIVDFWSMRTDSVWTFTPAAIASLMEYFGHTVYQETGTCVPLEQLQFEPQLMSAKDPDGDPEFLGSEASIRKGLKSPFIGLNVSNPRKNEVTEEDDPATVTPRDLNSFYNRAVGYSVADWSNSPYSSAPYFVHALLTDGPLNLPEENNVSLLHLLRHLPITLFNADQKQQDRPNDGECQSQSDPKEGMMEESRRTLADLKGTPNHPKKRSVSSEKIKSLVQETMADTEELSKVLDQIIEQRKEELRNLLGINDDMKQLGEQVLDDIEQAFSKYAKDLDDWKRAVEEKVTTRVEYKIPEMPTVDIKDPHMTFDDLLFNVTLRKPTIMIGPSGSGKTTAARDVARILDMEFSFAALGPTQTEAKFAGYPDAQGFFIPTEFYYRYRYGGVMLLDEMDAGNANVLVWLNAAIQNKVAAFPRGFMTQLEKDGFPAEAEKLSSAGGMVPMHPDCVILAAANTFGRGSDMVYQGRNALDGATLKRFKFLVWDYDEVLERKLSGDDLWVKFVQAVRASVNDLNMHHIVSPVDSIDGAHMIAAGQDWQKVAMQTVFAGLKEDEVRKIMKNQEYKTPLNDLHNRLQARQDNGAPNKEDAHASA